MQINLQKKLDKVFKMLCDQNSEVVKQINTYRDSYHQKRGRECQSDSPTKLGRKPVNLIEQATIFGQAMDRRFSVMQHSPQNPFEVPGKGAP